MLSTKMMFVTLVVLAICALLLRFPLYSNILIQALLIICVLLVGLGVYKAISHPMNNRDDDRD